MNQNNSIYVIIAGNINARRGWDSVPHVIGIHGKQTVNNNSQSLSEFVVFSELKVTNTFYIQKTINKYRLSVLGQCFLIDYIIINHKLASRLKKYSCIQR